MKIFKYPYGLFNFSIIVFIGGIIIEVVTISQVKHIPVTIASSILSFVLLIFGLIHLGIYQKISAEKYLAKFAKIIYWFGMLLLTCFLLDAFVDSFDIGVTGLYGKLFPLYFYSHLLLFVWLIVDSIAGFKS